MPSIPGYGTLNAGGISPSMAVQRTGASNDDSSNPYATIIQRAAAGQPQAVPSQAPAPAGAGNVDLGIAEPSPTPAQLIGSRQSPQWDRPATTAGNIAG